MCCGKREREKGGEDGEQEEEESAERKKSKLAQTSFLFFLPPPPSPAGDTTARRPSRRVPNKTAFTITRSPLPPADVRFFHVVFVPLLIMKKRLFFSQHTQQTKNASRQNSLPDRHRQRVDRRHLQRRRLRPLRRGGRDWLHRLRSEPGVAARRAADARLPRVRRRRAALRAGRRELRGPGRVQAQGGLLLHLRVDRVFRTPVSLLF